ncbi:MAG: molybdopterin-synthase adenylyltransferase MoeB, partial [Armatimonadetes bacterium]|nr:molybdopterin-synthase adenylyltransferase MoeB [Armatimonadota bacterium]
MECARPRVLTATGYSGGPCAGWPAQAHRRRERDGCGGAPCRSGVPSADSGRSPAGLEDTPALPAALSDAERRRYARHLLLPEVGPEGQAKLKAARVLCVGAGGLGSPVGLYLAAAGVGHLTLVDDDAVDESNLQRQVLYDTEDVGRAKPEAAQARLQRLNPHIRVEAAAERLTAANALPLVRAHDVVIDGSDNFATRYLANDACVLDGKAYVYGSIFRFDGQVSVFHARAGGPCYRCLFPAPPPPGTAPSCAEGGVLGVLPGVIGALQATECLKLILGQGTPLIGRVLLFDALEMEFREVRLRRSTNCPACGDHPSITRLVDSEVSCAGTNPAPPDAEAIVEITPRELKARLAAGEPLLLLDVREPGEWAICRIEGARLIPPGELPAR